MYPEAFPKPGLRHPGAGQWRHGISRATVSGAINHSGKYGAESRESEFTLHQHVGGLAGLLDGSTKDYCRAGHHQSIAPPQRTQTPPIGTPRDGAILVFSKPRPPRGGSAALIGSAVVPDAAEPPGSELVAAARRQDAAKRLDRMAHRMHQHCPRSQSAARRRCCGVPRRLLTGPSQTPPTSAGLAHNVSLHLRHRSPPLLSS